MATHPLIRFKRRYASPLLRVAGVVAVGVGRTDGAAAADLPALLLYVETDARIMQLRGQPGIQRLTRALQRRGWAMRFVQSGVFQATGGGDAQGSPLQIGGSLGTQDPPSTGTAGVVVVDAQGRRLLLSNAHVLNNANDAREREVFQPSPADGPARRIGRLACSVRLRERHANFVDAAVVELDADAALGHPSVGELAGYCASYGPGLAAVQVGRSSGEVRGRVQSVDTDVRVVLELDGQRRECLFLGQTVFEGDGAIQLRGDSGAVWVAEAERLAVALSFAASDNGRLSIASPFEWVAQVLGVSVPPGRVPVAPTLPAGETEGAVIEPLDDDTAGALRQQVLEAGRPASALEARVEGAWDAALRVDDLDDQDGLMDAYGTQLSGGTGDVTIYDLNIGPYTGTNKQNSMLPLGRVVVANTAGTGDYAQVYPSQGEYWYYDPVIATKLLNPQANSPQKLQLVCIYDGDWQVNNQPNPWLNGVLDDDSNMTKTLPLVPAKTTSADWKTVTDPSTTYAWNGTLEYQNSETEAASTTMGLVLGAKSTARNEAGSATAKITSRVWYLPAKKVGGAMTAPLANAMASGWYYPTSPTSGMSTPISSPTALPYSPLGDLDTAYEWREFSVSSD